MSTYKSHEKLGTQVEVHTQNETKTSSMVMDKTLTFLDLELFLDNSGII